MRGFKGLPPCIAAGQSVLDTIIATCRQGTEPGSLCKSLLHVFVFGLRRATRNPKKFGVALSCLQTCTTLPCCKDGSNHCDRLQN